MTTRLKFIFKTAFVSLLRNKTRAFLTVLGVIIGVASVILLTAIGTGLKNMITEQFESLGSNLIYVMPGKVFDKKGGFNEDSMRAGLLNSKFKSSHINQIKRIGLPIKEVLPVVQVQQRARFLGNTYTVTLVGTYPEYGKVRNLKTTQGSFFRKSDENGRKRVVVIGHKVQQELFPHVNPVGKTIVLGNTKFKIIGVVEKKGGGGMGGPDFDSWVYLPYSTAKQTFNLTHVHFILIKVANDKDIAYAKKLVETTLLKFLTSDDFSVIDQTELLSTIQTILNTLTAALAGIAGISLVVGGIGIMNIMLVSVTERTKEIGLRKAVGATSSDILIQFLIESATLSIFGGLIGILLGSLGSMAINRFLPASPTVFSILLAFFVSLGVGIVFGVFPARKASQLSPVEALRYE